MRIRQVCPAAGRSRDQMGACLPQLPPRLLLLGMVVMAASAPETADLVELCGRTWRGDALLLRSHPEFAARDTDCGLWLRAAAPGDRIVFQFRFFLVYSLSAAAPDASAPAPAARCAPGSYLQFYEGPPGAPRALGPPLCGLAIPGAVASAGPSLRLRLVTRGRRPRVDFVGEATSFRLGPCGDYFRCQNGRCIPPSLVCDHWGMDNCGDGSDQGSGPSAHCRGPLWTAAERSPPVGRDPAQQDAALEGPRLQGLALASMLLLASAGLLLGLLWCCCSWGWLTWQPGTCSLHLRHSRACTSCCTCPGRVAPGGLSKSAFPDPEGCP